MFPSVTEENGDTTDENGKKEAPTARATAVTVGIE